MRYIFIFISILVCCLIYKNNTQLFSSRALWIDDGKQGEPVAVFSHHVQDSSSIHEATYQYRSDINRRGIYDGIIDIHQKKIWQSEVLNDGKHTASKSSPAIDKDGIFIGADTSWFYAYEFSGALRWKFLTGYNGRGIHATGALDEHYVYFGAYNGRFYCLDKKTGEVQWAIRLGDTIGSSALLYKNEIYVSIETFNPPNGFVVKLNAHDGSFMWKSNLLGDQAHSSIAVDEKLGLGFVGANSKKFFAFNLKTGDFVWTKDMPGEIKSTPNVYQGNVYIADRGGYMTAMHAESGEIIWQTRISKDAKANEKDKGSQSSATVFADEKVIVVGTMSGSILGLNLGDGKILWQQENSISEFKASAIATRSQIKSIPWIAWIPCHEKAICALNPKTGRVLEEIDIGGVLSGVPVFFDGSLYFATDPIVSSHQPGYLMRYSPE